MFIGRINPHGYINWNNKMHLDKNKNKNAIISQNNVSIDEKQRRAIKEVENLKAHLKKSEAEIKKMRESSEIQLKCTIIARRIISGHKVPKSDHLYLAKHDSGLYQKAIILRTEREKPLKFKRVSNYEKMKSYDVQESYMNNDNEEY